MSQRRKSKAQLLILDKDDGPAAADDHKGRHRTNGSQTQKQNPPEIIIDKLQEVGR